MYTSNASSSAAVIAAGFLHDVVEDTDVSLEEIEGHFGAEVRQLVEGVTKLGGIHFTNRTEAQAENLRKMFLAMASDIRVVLVKLADRLHNMRTLGALRPEKQQRIATETRDIYAPLANRLGIGRFKWELEDLAFKVLEPDDFRSISQQVASKRSGREERLGVTVQLLRDRRVARGGRQRSHACVQRNPFPARAGVAAGAASARARGVSRRGGWPFLLERRLAAPCVCAPQS